MFRPTRKARGAWLQSGDRSRSRGKVTSRPGRSGCPVELLDQDAGSVAQQGRGAEEEKAEQRAGEGVPQPADAQAEEGKDQTEHAEGDKEKDDHGFRCF